MELLTLHTWSCCPYTHGVVTLIHMELLPLYTWSCCPYTHGVVTLIHTYKDAPLVGKGCAVIGKASVQSGPLQTGQVGSKQCRCQRLSRAVALDIGHPCGEHTRTSPTSVENTPGHRPPVWRTHQDIAHPCGEHTRRHRPPVWRTHQDIATRVENTPGEWARVTTGYLSVWQLRCLFLAHAFLWLSCSVKSFNIASSCQLRCLFLARAFGWLFYCHVKLFNIASSCQIKQKYVVKKRAHITFRTGVCCWVLE